MLINSKILGAIALYGLLLGTSYGLDEEQEFPGTSCSYTTILYVSGASDSDDDLSSSETRIEFPKTEELFIPYSKNKPNIQFQDTIHPNDVYNTLLTSGVKNDAFIIDGDGTITKEGDPGTFFPGQKATLRGDALNKIRALIKNGNTVLICTAWTPFEGMIERLEDVGFTEDDLEINGELPIAEEQLIKIKIEGQSTPFYFRYNQYGRLFSVKHLNIPKYEGYDIDSKYYRAKAFCLYILTQGNINFDTIHFLDDSLGNRRIFKDDINALNLYPRTPIHIYEIQSLGDIQRDAQKAEKARKTKNSSS